jgi:hypothetical protein
MEKYGPLFLIVHYCFSTATANFPYLTFKFCLYMVQKLFISFNLKMPNLFISPYFKLVLRTS